MKNNSTTGEDLNTAKEIVSLHSLKETKSYDVVIVGGGLAGLALSIQLAKLRYNVIVLEKERYPFHRVCGEYISFEAWDFLKNLGVDLSALKVSTITRLEVSGVNGKLLQQKLPLGGFGISRYLLDHTLAKLARKAGVTIEENSKVAAIVFNGSEFIIETAQKRYHSSIACGSFGKRSNLDVKWERAFIAAPKNKLNNFIGVKYHIYCNFPDDTIALHNFKNGYCGIVKIEDDKYCLCYLTTADNLQKSKGSIKKMEQTILCQNPNLKKIFSEGEFLFNPPVSISQISFDKKTQVENHVLMIGDAAGMITPLCGNGMSMALRGSKLAAEHIHNFLQKKITRDEMEKQYTDQWQQLFSRRLKTGRSIQRLFGKNQITNFFISVVKPFPWIINFLIRQTHGHPF